MESFTLNTGDRLTHLYTGSVIKLLTFSGVYVEVQDLTSGKRSFVSRYTILQNYCPEIG